MWSQEETSEGRNNTLVTINRIKQSWQEMKEIHDKRKRPSTAFQIPLKIHLAQFSNKMQQSEQIVFSLLESQRQSKFQMLVTACLNGRKP